MPDADTYWQSSPEHAKARAALDRLAGVPLGAPEAVWGPPLSAFFRPGADATYLTKIGCAGLPELVGCIPDLGPAYAGHVGARLAGWAGPPAFAEADFNRAVQNGKLALFTALLRASDYSDRKYIAGGIVGLVGEQMLAEYIIDHTDGEN